MHESEKWKWSHSVVSDSSRPHGLQSTRLLHPWDFLGKSTGVGCHRRLRKCSLGISNFLEEISIFAILLFSSIFLHWSLRKDFSSLLAILWNSAFRWVYLSFSFSFSYFLSIFYGNPMEYTVHGFLQARKLEWVTFPFSRGSFKPRDWTQVCHIADRFFTSWATGKPKNTGVGSLSLLQWIFPTQESNWGLLHCRWILYQLSYQESPRTLWLYLIYTYLINLMVIVFYFIIFSLLQFVPEDSKFQEKAMASGPTVDLHCILEQHLREGIASMVMQGPSSRMQTSFASSCGRRN